MGFLRKIGKKIKKKVKKLFSSPFGSILGGMAINFMFPGIGDFFNNTFKGAKKALGFGGEQATKELTANVITPTATTSAPTLTETISKNFIDKPIQAGKNFITSPIKTTKEFVKGIDIDAGEFVGDVATSLVTSTALAAMQGEPVDEGGYGRVASMQSSIPSQDRLLSAVNMQMPQLNIKSFDDMNKSLYYGVLSPQWLQHYNINQK